MGADDPSCLLTGAPYPAEVTKQSASNLDNFFIDLPFPHNCVDPANRGVVAETQHRTNVYVQIRQEVS